MPPPVVPLQLRGPRSLAPTATPSPRRQPPMTSPCGPSPRYRRPSEACHLSCMPTRGHELGWAMVVGPQADRCTAVVVAEGAYDRAARVLALCSPTPLAAARRGWTAV